MEIPLDPSISPADDDAISRYDFELPQQLIAREPAERREQARLLVVDRRSQSLSHHHIFDLPQLLRPHDLLVMNDTRVTPARLQGVRTRTGGRWEGLFVRVLDERRWEVIGQTRGRLLPGETLTLTPHGLPADANTPTLVLTLESRTETGGWVCRPQTGGSAWDLLEQFGETPLPPYLERDATDRDRERYQTVYAQEPGAVAAPTAGLHFTPELLETLRDVGVDSARVTLHVGLGTFRPVAVERLAEHLMHAEWCRLPNETVQAIEETRARRGRIVAVGTTTVRTLESAAGRGPLTPWEGETSIFIRPPYEFRCVDALLTNFHLPRSTLLVLVSALAGRELIRSAYAEAIREGYRFYSYGDAMLIL